MPFTSLIEFKVDKLRVTIYLDLLGQASVFIYIESSN